MSPNVVSSNDGSATTHGDVTSQNAEGRVVFPASEVKGYICSAQFRNLRNLEIAQRILGIAKLRANLEIVQTILRLRNTFAQSLDCANILCNLRTCDLSMWLTASDWIGTLAGRKPFIQAVSCSRGDIMRSTTVSDFVYRSAAGGFLRDFVRSDSGRMAAKPTRP